MYSLSWQKHTKQIIINIPVAVQADRQETKPYHLVKHHLPAVAELQHVASRNRALNTDPSTLDS